MSRTNGCLLTCDRCGKQIFLKLTGEGEMDGGYTRWNKFEPVPEGWGLNGVKNLCPECYAKWKELEKEFMDREKEFYGGVK